MSDVIIKLIPKDPEFVPCETKLGIAKDWIKLNFNYEKTEYILTDEVRFIDQGENFENIHCPFCSRIITLDWWHEAMENCVVYPPIGIPKVEFNHKIPNDLFDFYTVCGGMQLFKQSNFPMEIMKPNKFVLVNPLIIGELCEGDISVHWYKIVNDLNGDCITIDLNERRLGKCYDSFHETHGLVGQSKIVAYTFTELLNLLIQNKGETLF